MKTETQNPLQSGQAGEQCIHRTVAAFGVTRESAVLHIDRNLARLRGLLRDAQAGKPTACSADWYAAAILKLST